MATSFAQPILQVFDDYGSILAGGLIYTYEAGTTTPLATYQDLAGAVANTNPVVLDAAGRATVRLTDGVAYKFVIKDASGETLLTLDDITVGASFGSNADAYYVHLSFAGTPAAQGFMGGHVFTSAVTFPIDFEGSQGSVRTAPGSEYIISVRKNDTEVGTITIGTDGSVSFETNSHVTVSFIPGDTVDFIGPDAVGSAADFRMTLEGDAA